MNDNMFKALGPIVPISNAHMALEGTQTPLVPPPAPQSSLDNLRVSYKRGIELLKNKQIPKGLISAWFGSLRTRLQGLYGSSAPIVKSIRQKQLDVQKSGISREAFESEVVVLKGLIDQMEYTSGSVALHPLSSPSIPPVGNNIFIIHGHDELNTRRLTDLLQNHFGVKPIIILARAGMSRPLIDKYEDSASSCSFAFALVTPDDEIRKPDNMYYQARPNVIFEIGWFVGRLGRRRVAILLKEGTTIHSDLHGVSRIQFRDNIEEKYLEIQRELNACGLV